MPARCTNFASALPARGASAAVKTPRPGSPLPRRCLHGVHPRCPSCSVPPITLPRRCLHGVHLRLLEADKYTDHFASALPARGASAMFARCTRPRAFASALPARGASGYAVGSCSSIIFASALPARGASVMSATVHVAASLCLGAACTGCIYSASISRWCCVPLPRRCLHGVHRRSALASARYAGFASALPARGAS